MIKNKWLKNLLPSSAPLHHPPSLMKQLLYTTNWKITSFTTSKNNWKTKWIKNETRRALFQHQQAPNPADARNQLERKHQCNIFRLRTGHALLNAHRNRLDPLAPPNCRHCNYPSETVEHHLLHCGQLNKLRQQLLPEKPTIFNCLFGNRDQLIKTSQYHTMALWV